MLPFIKDNVKCSTCISLCKRPLDLLFVIFFSFALPVVYFIDLEQLWPIDTYPLIFPPTVTVNMIRWWGAKYDAVLMAREPWYRVTIVIDALLVGPYYIVAIYAYVYNKQWIKIPTIIYATLIITCTSCILAEEMFGRNKTSSPGIVFFAYIPFIIVPLVAGIKALVK